MGLKKGGAGQRKGKASTGGGGGGGKGKNKGATSIKVANKQKNKGQQQTKGKGKGERQSHPKLQSSSSRTANSRAVTSTVEEGTTGLHPQRRRKVAHPNGRAAVSGAVNGDAMEDAEHVDLIAAALAREEGEEEEDEDERMEEGGADEASDDEDNDEDDDDGGGVDRVSSYESVPRRFSSALPSRVGHQLPIRLINGGWTEKETREQRQKETQHLINKSRRKGEEPTEEGHEEEGEDEGEDEGEESQDEGEMEEEGEEWNESRKGEMPPSTPVSPPPVPSLSSQQVRQQMEIRVRLTRTSTLHYTQHLICSAAHSSSALLYPFVSVSVSACPAEVGDRRGCGECVTTTGEEGQRQDISSSRCCSLPSLSPSQSSSFDPCYSFPPLSFFLSGVSCRSSMVFTRCVVMRMSPFNSWHWSVPYTHNEGRGNTSASCH